MPKRESKLDTFCRLFDTIGTAGIQKLVDEQLAAGLTEHEISKLLNLRLDNVRFFAIPDYPPDEPRR